MDIYTTADLIGAMDAIIVPQNFFLDRYFRGANKVSTKQEIAFDEVLTGLPTMAPFVSPDLPAKSQNRSGFKTKMFVPAYVKPKHLIKPFETITRLPGEALWGDKTPEERRDEAVIAILEQQKQQLYTRFEYMAACSLINGFIKIEGEDYETKFIDFDRDSNNTVVISNDADKWTNEKADIASQLEAYSDQVLSKTGYAATDVIMSPAVWKNFIKNKNVLEEADLRRGVTNIPNFSPQAKPGIGAQYRGQYGNFSIFVYSRSFVEQNGQQVNVLGENEILLVAPPEENGKGGVEGIKVFGAIMDMEALVPLDMYPKVWIEKDPPFMQLMTQSAPLMLPGRPNATLKAMVL